MAKKKAATGGQRLNRELLERARQQARAIEAEEAAEAAESDTADAASAEATPAVAPTSRRVEAARAAAASSGGASRRVSTAKRLREKNEEARKKSLTADEISEILANPTKFVPESELRAQYGFVLRDLRNMAALAAASFLFLVVLAVLLPK